MSYHHLEIDEPASGVVRCVMSNPPTHTLVAGKGCSSATTRWRSWRMPANDG